jgi:multidrug efflux pump subunit AcrB
MKAQTGCDPGQSVLPGERRDADGRRSIVRTALSVGLAVMLATLVVTAVLGIVFSSGGKVGRMTFDFGGGIAPCLAGRC